ncbi:hypothetical protein ACHAXS_011660 [Conticribra weissflogii]
MEALEQIIGEDAASAAMLERFVELSTARCPKIELSECALDALRFLGGGERATCGVCNNTAYVGIVPEKCPFESDWPSQLWENMDKQDKSYLERACCPAKGSEVVNDSAEVCTIDVVNETPNTSGSSTKSTMIYIIVGASVGGALVLSCLLAMIVKRKKKYSQTNNPRFSAPQACSNNASTQNNRPTTTIVTNQTHFASSNQAHLASSNRDDEERATHSHDEEGTESATRLPVAKAIKLSPSAPPMNPNYE